METALDSRVASIAGVVRSHAEKSERDHRLADAVVDALHATGLYRLQGPPPHGSGLPVERAIGVFERVAQLDGATGWNVAVANQAALLVGEVDDRTVLDDPRGLVAGSLNPGTITATRTAGGYRFSGRLTFASGSSHATCWFAAGAVTDETGQPVLDPELGTPQVVAGFLPLDAGTVLDTWHPTGLRATASADVSLDEVWVPAERTLSLTSLNARGGVPYFSQLGAGLAAVVLGIAQHALDEFTALAAERRSFGSAVALRESVPVQVVAAEAQGAVSSARAYLVSALTRANAAARPVPEDVLAELRLAYVTAATNATRACDAVYRAAGSGVLQDTAPLARAWRDAHTAAQHLALSARHLERVGRVLLGLPAGPGPL